MAKHAIRELRRDGLPDRGPAAPGYERDQRKEDVVARSEQPLDDDLGDDSISQHRRGAIEVSRRTFGKVFEDLARRAPSAKPNQSRRDLVLALASRCAVPTYGGG